MRGEAALSEIGLIFVFIDEIKIHARAGHGGKGCVAFVREAYRPKGGPSGGNGGRGGDVILEASHDLNNLVNQFYQPRLIAEDGHHGMGKGMDGPAGKDLIIKVPCGTLVWKVRDTKPVAQEEEDEDDDQPARNVIPSSTGQRPVFRVAGGLQAAEYNLAEEDASRPRHNEQEGSLVA